MFEWFMGYKFKNHDNLKSNLNFLFNIQLIYFFIKLKWLKNLLKGL